MLFAASVTNVIDKLCESGYVKRVAHASDRRAVLARITPEGRAMTATGVSSIVTGVDFVSVPTQDLERGQAFYGTTLGLRRSMHRPDYHFAEFETGTVTLSVVDPERMGVGSFRPNANHLPLHVAAARAALDERGVVFAADTFDTGVCHMAFFADPTATPSCCITAARHASPRPESATRRTKRTSWWAPSGRARADASASRRGAKRGHELPE